VHLKKCQLESLIEIFESLHLLLSESLLLYFTEILLYPTEEPVQLSYKIKLKSHSFALSGIFTYPDKVYSL
jgi:hypothetical protein